jgi:hypothetical protein
VRSLIGRNAAVDVANAAGETADQLIVQLNNRRQERVNNRQLSSSPFQADGAHHHATAGAVQPPGSFPNGLPFEPFSHALDGASSTPNGVAVPDVHKSEAALALTSHIIPTIFTKTKTLATSLDQEIAEKDAEVAEYERGLELRKAERENLLRERERIEAGEREAAADQASDEALERELEELEKECFDFVDQEQAWTLKELLEKENAAAKDSALSEEAEDEDETMADDRHTETSADLAQKKTSLTRSLIMATRRRNDLVRQIVSHLSVAGVLDGIDGKNNNDGSNKSGGGGGGDEAETRRMQYRALITGCLGLGDADVEGLLPEMVAELEESRGIDGV